MAKQPWTQRDGKRFLFEAGLLCNLFSLILIFLAFVSPYWVVSWPRVYSPFKKLGLWEACFAGLVLETDPTQKAYHGCWWILAPEFWSIRYWLMPAWFTFTQVAVTFCFVAEMIGFGIMSIMWCYTGFDQTDTEKKRRDPFVLLHVSCIITLSTALLMSITTMTFAIMFRYDINWMPYHQFNYLSWSYGLAVVSTFFSVFSFIAQATYVMIVRQELRQPPTTIPSMTASLDNSKYISVSKSDLKKSGSELE